MLRELIGVIAEGQLHSQTELARRLGVSEGLVERMLEDLARMGYLEPIAGCADQCVACPLAKMCIVGHPRRAWVLRDKGRRAARGGQCGERRETTGNIAHT